MKIGDETIVFFSRVSLSKFSLEALFLSWVNEVFILGWEWNVKSQFFPNRVVWWLGLATGLSCEFKSRANSLGLLSCSATAGMTLQLPCMLHTCANFGGLPVASQPQVSASLHNLEHFFTLSHSLPLQDSHLNTGLLIAKIQTNLTRNKANKMVDKIQPYTEQLTTCNWLTSGQLAKSHMRSTCWKLKSQVPGGISRLISWLG